MVVYSISDLENLSGVKAHTIRIWEKRYEILTPRRTPTNIRYYLDEDLRKVINIALLNKNGIKISKIATMNEEEIQKKVGELADIDQSFQGELDTLTLSLIDLDERKFSKLLEKNIKVKGFQQTMLELIYPLLDKLSIMWMAGSIKTVHERFMSHMIRRKCTVAIENCHQSRKESFLIFLPEGEVNELSLLFLHYLIAARGFRVINAGSDMDITSLAEVLDIHEPEYLYTIVNAMTDWADMEEYVIQLASIFQHSKLIISGLSRENLNLEKLPANVLFVSSSEDTIMYLDKLDSLAVAANEKH